MSRRAAAAAALPAVDLEQSDPAGEARQAMRTARALLIREQREIIKSDLTAELLARGVARFGAFDPEPVGCV